MSELASALTCLHQCSEGMGCFISNYNKSEKKPHQTNKIPPKRKKKINPKKINPKTCVKSNPRPFQVNITTLLFKTIQFIRKMRKPAHKILFLKWKKKIPKASEDLKQKKLRYPGESTCKTVLRYY